MKRISCYIILAALGIVVGGNSAHAAPESVNKRIAAEQKISEQDADKQVDAVINAIRAELVAGNEVTIRNFGRFYLQARDAREGRNPKTGEKIQIPAKKYPKFASADGLKKAVNQ